jgi:hypothetical protein
MVVVQGRLSRRKWGRCVLCTVVRRHGCLLRAGDDRGEGKARGTRHDKGNGDLSRDDIGAHCRMPPPFAFRCRHKWACLVNQRRGRLYSSISIYPETQQRCLAHTPKHNVAVAVKPRWVLAVRAAGGRGLRVESADDGEDAQEDHMHISTMLDSPNNSMPAGD